MTSNGTPASMSYCSNCTRLVNDSNSTRLSSVLSKHNMPCRADDVELGTVTTNQPAESEQLCGVATILEALHTVCDMQFLYMNNVSEVLCSRCEDHVRQMLKSFQLLTHYSTKHSHQLFEILKSRTDQLRVTVTERQETERQLNESIGLLLFDSNDSMDGPEHMPEVSSPLPPPPTPPPPRKNNKKKYYKKKRDRGLRKLTDEEKRRISIENLMKQKPKHKRAAYLRLLSTPRQAPATPQRRFVKEITLLKEAEAFTKSLTRKEALMKQDFKTDGVSASIRPWSIRRYHKNLITKELVIRIPRVDIYGIGAYDFLQPEVKEEASDDDYLEIEQEATAEQCHSAGKPDFDFEVRENDPRDKDYEPPVEGTSCRRLPEKKYWCLDGECERGFARAEAYARHVEVFHHKPRPFVCRYCVEVFTLKAHLLEHMNMHKGESQAPVCQVEGCGKVFPTMKHLRIHNITVHEEKKFTCTKCPMAFTYNCHLVKHDIAVHPDETLERPHSCDQCDLTFAMRHQLSKHVKGAHSTEKLYECSVCAERFRYKKQLIAHEKTHYEKEQFKCQYCDMMLESSVEKKQHEKFHRKILNYACESCGKTFKRRSHLTIHLLNIHGMERKEAKHAAEYSGFKRHSEPGPRQRRIRRKNFTIIVQEGSNVPPLSSQSVVSDAAL